MPYTKDLSYLALEVLARPNSAASLLRTTSKGTSNGCFASNGTSNLFEFWGVFTVDASSPGNAQQSFIAIAKACGTDPNERAAKSWLSSSDRPWLLLIDNADSIELDIERYFPDGEHGLTLITTQNLEFKMHGTKGRLKTYNELLVAVEAIQEGRKQTEISSTLWKMICDKIVELKAKERLDSDGDPSVPPSTPDTASRSGEP